jgi:hypothetical protein
MLGKAVWCEAAFSVEMYFYRIYKSVSNSERSSHLPQLLPQKSNLLILILN